METCIKISSFFQPVSYVELCLPGKVMLRREKYKDISLTALGEPKPDDPGLALKRNINLLL